MEVSDAEVQGKWLTASDFKIGKTLTISNRRFLIYECDEFTRQWYRTEMNFEQPEKIEIPVESNSKKVSIVPFILIRPKFSTNPILTFLGTKNDYPTL